MSDLILVRSSVSDISSIRRRYQRLREIVERQLGQMKTCEVLSSFPPNFVQISAAPFLLPSHFPKKHIKMQISTDPRFRPISRREPATSSKSTSQQWAASYIFKHSVKRIARMNLKLQRRKEKDETEYLEDLLLNEYGKLAASFRRIAFRVSTLTMIRDDFRNKRLV